MANVAAISVIASATTAVAVPFLTAWMSERKSRTLSQARRRAEIRGVVDSASERIVRLWWAYSHVIFAWRHGAAATGPESRDRIARLRQEQEDAAVALARLAVRLGPSHDVVKAYDDVIALARDFRDIAAAHAAGHELALYKDDTDRVREAYYAARDRYFATAEQVLGVGDLLAAD